MWKTILVGVLNAVIVAGAASDEEDSGSVVRYKALPVVTYNAFLAEGWLVVTADHAEGWHTYSMDNVDRAREATGNDRPETELPTRIRIRSGLSETGPWRQTPPADLSDPAMHWYTWGFEKTAVFAVPVERVQDEPVSVTVDGQACNASSCAMIRDIPLHVEELENLPADLKAALSDLVETE